MVRPEAPALGESRRITATPRDLLPPRQSSNSTEMGALLPYRRARTLLEDLFPLGEPPMVETIRQRTLQVGARLECQAAAPPRSPPATEAKSIALSIDGGHVRSVRSYQVRSFEIIVAQVAVTLNSAPRHAPNRQVVTLQSGTSSRSKPAPDHAVIRHLLRRVLGTHFRRFSLGRTNLA